MDYRGLTSEEAEAGLKLCGLNEVEEAKNSFWSKFLKLFLSPINLMLWAAAFLSLFDNKIFDFYLIIFLIFFNFFVAFWQEKKADNAIVELKKKLITKVKVLRDGVWLWIDSVKIAPKDIVEIAVGDLVAADLKILESNNLSINESVLTGESLPKEKSAEDFAYSGSFVTTGWARAEVVKTGKNTYFGKTLSLADKSLKRSALEKDILQVSKFLMFVSLAAIVFLTVFFAIEKISLKSLATLDLSLFIAGIPIALPTVMTLIISIGALELARRKVIVRRLSSLEDLANINLFLTDKTGTLTKNEIIIEKIISYNDYSEKDVVIYAAFNSLQADRNPIDKAIFQKKEIFGLKENFEILNFIPADSSRKRTTSLVKYNGLEITVSVGAPQIIESFCLLSDQSKKKYEDDVKEAAGLGYRSIAVALSPGKEEKAMRLVGLILMTDPLDDDAKETISFMQNNGIKVRMLTGDNFLIAKRFGDMLGLEGAVIRRGELENFLSDTDGLERISVFSEILPEDKYRVVEEEKKNYIVAVTGDGVNDIPAIKAADIGIAVDNAVDALKSSADIVLLSSGILIIKDAFIEARKIFERLYSYSVYRISESFRLIITVLIIGILYKSYPLMPVQLIILAFLNDVPVVSLAFNRVKYATQPKKVNASERLLLSSFFGFVGVLNSLILLAVALKFLHLSWSEIQTMYFLKLTVSGHMLIYVAHTKERWFKFFPSKEVVLATTGTQILATIIALKGIFMNPISISLILFIWIWAFFWMQISELMKDLQKKLAN